MYPSGASFSSGDFASRKPLTLWRLRDLEGANPIIHFASVGVKILGWPGKQGTIQKKHNLETSWS